MMLTDVESLRALCTSETNGEVRFEIRQTARGELVLVPPDGPQAGWPDADARSRLSRCTAVGRPALVVERRSGGYAVLAGQSLDEELHLPLSLDDAEVLADASAAYGRYGRRGHDFVALTPWSSEDAGVVFDPDTEEFADVALVALDAEGSALEVRRGVLGSSLLETVRDHLLDGSAEPGAVYGVITNPFGEFACVRVGEVLEPFEDVRNQTIVRGVSLLEGVTTLPQAAEYLRAFADRLAAAAASGWVLPQPVVGDYAVLERSAPDRSNRQTT